LLNQENLFGGLGFQLENTELCDREIERLVQSPEPHAGEQDFFSVPQKNALLTTPYEHGFRQI
jgi:hypothetical protein